MLFRLVFLSVFLSFLQLASGQGMSFKKDSLQLEPFEYYSNVLAINIPQGNYQLSISQPEGFSLNNKLPESISVQSNQQKYQVLRFRVDQSLSSTTASQVCLELSNGKQSYQACFKLIAKEYHKVNAHVLKPSIEVYEGESSIASGIRVINDGNVSELVNISVDAPYPLRGQPLLSFILDPGEDTLINYPISITGEIDRDLPTLRFAVKTDQRTLLHSQKFIYLRSAYQQELYRNRIIPFNAALQFQTINGNLPTLTVGITGNTPINESHKIGYRYFGLQHLGFTSAPQFLNGWLSWDSPISSLQVGRLQYQGLISMNSPAVKLGFNYDKFLMESMFMYDERNGNQQVYAKIREVNEGESKTLRYHYLNNKVISSHSNLLDYNYQLQYNENLKIGISPAVAITSNKLGSRLTGQLGGNLFYQKDEYRISANGLITSIAHPTYNRGENSIFLEAVRRRGSTSYGLSVQHTYIRAKVVTAEGFRTLPSILRGQYDVFKRESKNQTNIQYGIGAEVQEYKGLGSVYIRPLFLITKQLSNNSRILGNLNIGPNFFLDSGRVAYRHGLRVQYFLGNFQSLLRYREGPQDYYEQLIYNLGDRRTGLTQFRVQQNFYIGEKISRLGAFAEYTHQHVAGFKRYTLGANLYFRLFKKGQITIQEQFSFGGAFPVNMVNVQCNFFIPAPIPLTKLHPDLTVFLIKDLNSNGVLDADDLPIVAEYVAIDDNWLITDEYGVVKGKKLKEGIHSIDLSKVQLQGWVPAGESLEEVIVNGDTEVYLFFNRSKVLDGKIEVKRDKRSKWYFDLEYIRVEAIAENGKIYTALTDEEGNFSFNLPAGKYTVRYNNKVFSAKYFKVINTEVEVSLIEQERTSVVFEVRENKRRINIRN